MTATFDLDCSSGTKGIIEIGYLKSYISMGAARVTVTSSPEASQTTAAVNSIKHPDSDEVYVASAVMDGAWATAASVPELQIINIPKIGGGDDDIRGGFGKVRVTFEALTADREGLYAGDLCDDCENIDRGDRKFKINNIQCC